MTAPPDQVDKMDAETFFSLFVKLLKDNPPHANDYPIVDRMKRIGLQADKPFNFNSAPENVRAALKNAPPIALKQIKKAFTTGGKMSNGWSINLTTIGTYGTDYLRRAGVAYAGLGANVIEDAVYPTAFTDANNMPLDSAKKYVLHFEKNQLPPVRAFWSLTMYDQRQLFTANAINRYAIGDRDKLKFNSDGSLDLYVQRQSPGAEKEANWLPTPASGEFTMNMRLYWPKHEVLDGSWAPPPVKTVK